ncbi:hypothetical protein [Pseudomonas oligotrophica]|uniref:hypothetical protein n=1 Tax=Pseudomonas oligotrophica TaxID=2912055 RepID=UPI001F3516BB|nr:hypothetical protein [Pseudomonas oligotrophica]MCF7200945.1 hypothetical protein [Pseudomonas oligotrophica]
MMEFHDERRSLHALREHIDCLLARGAVIRRREPLTLELNGRQMTVEHGMLIGEKGALDLIRLLASMKWDNAERNRVIGICLQQLDQAIEEVELPLPGRRDDDRGR